MFWSGSTRFTFVFIAVLPLGEVNPKNDSNYEASVKRQLIKSQTAAILSH